MRARAAGEDQRGSRWLAGGAAVAMLLFGWALRHYGLDLVDEGTLLAQTERVRSGQWPYRDFHSGYGPASFLWNAWLLSTFGVRIEVVRVGLVVVHAVGVATTALLAARALGGAEALVVVALVFGFFFPVAPGGYCPWNVPYPGWYAQALGGLALLAALAEHRRGAAVLVLSGVLWGLAFVFKQNVGVLGLGGVLVWRAIERASGEGPRGYGAVFALAMVGGLGMIVAGGALGPTGTIAVGVPIMVLAVRVARLRPGPGLLRDGGWLAMGFVAVALPIVAFSGARAGWSIVAREVLHLGSGAAAVYGVPYPSVTDWWAALGEGPPSLHAVRAVADLAWLFVFPVALMVAAAGVGGRTQSRAWRLVVPSAVLGYAQLFPRADFWHVLPIAGLATIVTVGEVGRAATRLGGARGMRVVAGLLVVLAVGRWLPTFSVLRAVMSPRPPGSADVARAGIRWDLATSPAVRAVPDVVNALAGAPEVIGFPALGIFNFLSGAPSPLRHDYFFPGLLDAEEQAALGATLHPASGVRVVVLREPIAFFRAALATHGTLDTALRTAFPEVRKVGPYEIREAAR